MSRLSLSGKRWNAVRLRVLDRDGHVCEDCGGDADSADHIKPLAHFSPEDWAAELQYDEDNLRALCRTCNARRAARVEVRTTWFSKRYLNSTT